MSKILDGSKERLICVINAISERGNRSLDVFTGFEAGGPAHLPGMHRDSVTLISC